MKTNKPVICLKGTSAEQDNRFSDKEKKLMKQMRFADSLSKKVCEKLAPVTESILDSAYFMFMLIPLIYCRWT